MTDKNDSTRNQNDSNWAKNAEDAAKKAELKVDKMKAEARAALKNSKTTLDTTD